MGKHSKDENVQSKKKNKNKRKRLIIFAIILIIIICAGIFVAQRVNELGGNWLAFIMGHNKETVKNLDELQILILGESTGMSDTIIVAKYNPSTQEASMLSIPRDTFVGDDKADAGIYDKINAQYSGGETPEKTLEAVNKVTGLDIKYYIIVDTEALVKLVDTIGGVEFDVPIDMKYDDNKQNLHIDLKKGVQTLTGKQVEQVVRFRHNNDWTTYPPEYGIEDYGRMRTQRDVIVAVAKQTIKLKNITEIGNIIDIMSEYVKTNINLSDIKDYIPYAIEMNLDNIKTKQLPGESKVLNGIWFFLPDEEEVEEVVNELFLNQKEDEEENANNEIANTVTE